MPQKKAPCKGCNERRVGCHSSCERYGAFLIEHQKEQDIKRKEIELSKAICEMNNNSLKLAGKLSKTKFKPKRR